jgi:hypothetical protein
MYRALLPIFGSPHTQNFNKPHFLFAVLQISEGYVMEIVEKNIFIV